MIRALARNALRGLRALAAEPDPLAAEPDERAMLTWFAPKIARYRALGARIADHVRLIGELDSVNPHLIEIGDYSVIGKGSILLTHGPIKGARPVTIGRFVYIGFGAIVLPGVTLGDHCMVGAGAVVTRSAPAASILVGNPARVLRTLTADERTHIEDTLRHGRVFGRDANRPDVARA